MTNKEYNHLVELNHKLELRLSKVEINLKNLKDKPAPAPAINQKLSKWQKSVIIMLGLILFGMFSSSGVQNNYNLFEVLKVITKLFL